MSKEMDEIPTLDLRRRRAESLAVALLHELEDALGDVDRRDVLERLFDVLYKNGAAWTTDEERAKMGFEPRDEFGWTPSETVRLRKQKLEAMQMIAAGLTP